MDTGSSDYRDVLRELKKDQVVGEAILPLYRKRLAEIEAIIVRENIVTLPARKGAIRLASPAETAQVPAPHMVAPRMIGNTGEYGEFVLPLNAPGAGDDASLAYDDFTSDGASWTLTSHESRPGHELQFAGMVEQGRVDRAGHLRGEQRQCRGLGPVRGGRNAAL